MPNGRKFHQITASRHECRTIECDQQRWRASSHGKTVVMAGLHPPKIEVFDTATSINTDPKGFPRTVDRWDTISLASPKEPPEESSEALYMARSADHPRFGYLESWLLPTVDLRVNRFHFRNGSGYGAYPHQDLYIDICRIEPPSTPESSIWRTTDLYIDVVTYGGGFWEVLDLEELGEALLAGFVDAEIVSQALESAQRIIAGIVSTGSPEEYLRRQGFNLQWAQPESVILAPPENQK